MWYRNIIKNKPYISLKYLLIYTFLLLFLLPLIIINITTHYNNINMVSNTMNDAARQNLMQVKKNIQLTLATYDYMLYQVYTDRAIIDLIDNINNNEDNERSCMELTEHLSSSIYGQTYVQAISIITSNGKFIFFDRLKGYDMANNWLGNNSISIENIYKQTQSQKSSYIFTTKNNNDFAENISYYMHIAHPIADYRNVNSIKGIVLLSIDLNILNRNINAASSSEPDNENYYFILDENNNIISFPQTNYIGRNVLITNSSSMENALKNFILQNNLMNDSNLNIQVLSDDIWGWKFIRVANNSHLINYLTQQYQITAFIIFSTTFFLLLIISFINQNIFNSFNNLIINMRVSKNYKIMSKKHRPVIKEIDIIYQNFEQMLQHINKLIAHIKTMTKQQKDAEIKSLENQINPHFLYNSLDTINWLAIDSGQYQISDAIHSLAQILRYSITDIHIPVPINKEVTWLHSYLHLHQMRSKDNFTYTIEVAPTATDCIIYKMLLQPFIENAIIHGLREQNPDNWLSIKISAAFDTIKIIIYDNGCGIEADTMCKLQQLLADANNNQLKRIGIYNAYTRLKLYYGEKVTLTIDSQPRHGTTINISLPAVREKCP